MKILSAIKKFFSSKPKLSPDKTPPYPPQFFARYYGPARQEISSNDMKVHFEWNFPTRCEFQPEKAKIGEVGDTIIVTALNRVDRSSFFGTFLIEKCNVPALIKIFEDAYQSKWNHGECSSIIASDPDFIEVSIGCLKDGNIMRVVNYRDVLLDGRRGISYQSAFELDFSIEHTKTFLAELKKISPQEPTSFDKAAQS